MKRNITLLIALLGLLLLEYSCTIEEPSCSGSSEMSITGISSVKNMRIDSTNNWVAVTESSIAFDELVFHVNLEWEMMALSSAGNFAAFAAVAPFSRWKPDSVLITEDGVDIIDLFTINNHASMEQFLSEENPYHYGGLELSLLVAPQVEESREFKLTFYSGEEIFETTTDPIIITP